MYLTLVYFWVSLAQAMFRDIKLNYEQLTKNQLQKKCEWMLDKLAQQEAELLAEEKNNKVCMSRMYTQPRTTHHIKWYVVCMHTRKFYPHTHIRKLPTVTLREKKLRGQQERSKQGSLIDKDASVHHTNALSSHKAGTAECFISCY